MRAFAAQVMPKLVIDRLDVYWVRIPLAFVWKTSYADQSVKDTILVRMESEGQYAWGESCPPYIPAYSAEHTLAVFHTLREHMAPRIVGQDIETAQDLLDLLRLGHVAGDSHTHGIAHCGADDTTCSGGAGRRAPPLTRCAWPRSSNGTSIRSKSRGTTVSGNASRASRAISGPK